jgi:hypothetical protein
MSDKPAGSGYFAVFCGLLFIVALVVLRRISIESFDPEVILQVWLAFMALLLISWGLNRAMTTANRRWIVGQDTINWLVGILAATFVLMALLGDIAERRKAREHEPTAASGFTH